MDRLSDAARQSVRREERYGIGHAYMRNSYGVGLEELSSVGAGLDAQPPL